MLKKNICLFIVCCSCTVLFAQNDTIKLKNGDELVGKVKGMTQSILTFKTNYSDSDFKIKWLEVKEFNSPRTFIVALNNGERIHSVIHMNTSNHNEIILDIDGEKRMEKITDIVFIDRFDKRFFSRIHASVDFGISLKKAQNYQELSGNLDLSYATQNWKYTFSVATNYSKQDSTANISRNQIDIGASRFLPKDWFTAGTVSLLSNSDQNLRLRATESVMGGYYFVNSNQIAIATAAGLAYNFESYTDNLNPDKNSMESFVKAQFNKYDVGNKLSANASVTASPSITEKGRFRLDTSFYLKYKITSDLYIKTNLTYNFDNQPAAGASKGDYVFQTSFGWDNN